MTLAAHTLFGIRAAYWNVALLKTLVVLAVLPTGTMVIVYVFLFKMVSHLQSRLGPMEVGFHGTLQLPAEVLKFAQKEDARPARADKWVFSMAPLVVRTSTFLVYVVLPAGPRAVASNLDTGVLFALAA